MARKVIKGKTLQFRVNPSGLSIFQSVGGHIWPASDFLVDYMVQTDLVQGKTVLELGSGCGYVGIASAMLGATKTTLTDMLVFDSNKNASRVLLDNCDYNIAANSAMLSKANIETQVLHWGEEHKRYADSLLCRETGHAKYDIILGSDVTYEMEGSVGLFWTIAYILQQQHVNSRSPCRCILCHEYRLDETTARVLESTVSVGLKHTELCKSSPYRNMGQDRQFVLWEMMLV